MRFILPIAALVAGVTLFISQWADQGRHEYIERIKLVRSEVYFIESYSRAHGADTRILIQKVTDEKVATILAKAGFITVKPGGEREVVLEKGPALRGGRLEALLTK
jgi:lipopolysaccharide export system permease protein